MSASDTLRAARSLLVPEGAWGQGIAILPARYRCSFLAIGAVSKSVDEASRAVASLRHAIGEENIVLWNDAPERTQAQVIAAFDVAIARDEE